MFQRLTRSLFGLVLIAGLVVTGAPPAAAAPGDITTIAGGRVVAVSPSAIALDADGNVIIANALGNVIQRIDAGTGEVTVLAGNGTAGFSGDGSQAIRAQLSRPTGVEVDDDGNIYISDSVNHRVRKVATNGKISTVAGDGSPGAAGDGGPASIAQLNSPNGLTMDDDGNLYVADANNHRIRKIDDSGTITTIAGDGTSGFGGDDDLAVDAQLHTPGDVTIHSDGTLYIADQSNHRIRKVDLTGIITTIAGTEEFGFSGDGGPAAEAQLALPDAVALDADGNLFIADLRNSRIRRIDATTGEISTVAGNGIREFTGDAGPAIAAGLDYPGGVVVDSAGQILIADTGNARVRVVDTAGNIDTLAGNGTIGFGGDDEPAIDAQLYLPDGVALDADDNLFVADQRNNRVRMIDDAGIISTVAGGGVFEDDDDTIGDEGQATDARLNSPTGITIDAAGNLYIADTGNFRIRKVATTGVITTIVGDGVAGSTGDGGPAIDARLSRPRDLAVDADGALYIVDEFDHRIRKVSPSGVISTVAGSGVAGFAGDGGAADSALLNSPTGIAIADDGTLYIADTGNLRIRRVDSTGVITSVVGNGSAGSGGDGGPARNAQLTSPTGLAIDSAGNLLIAELGGHRVRRVDGSGRIATVAGDGTLGFSGDRGAATDAQLNRPSKITVDSRDNMFVSDQGNHRVRRVRAKDGPPTIANDTAALIAPALAVIDVISNDVPAGDSPIDSVTATAGSQGTTSVNPDLTITYTPGISSATTDVFTYEACAAGECATATVTITITPPMCGAATATLWGTDAGDTITGTSAADVIVGFGGDDQIAGAGGSDLICGDAGDDVIDGGAGNDRLFGAQGADVMSGGNGDDTLHGNRGDDILNGDDGDDRLFGYANNDTINGGDGDDRLHGHFGDDALDGGAGEDRLFGYGDNDTLIGGPDDDLLTGNFGDDNLSGGAGNDILFGADGDDVLSGNSGDDVLNGNSLDDILDGGQGDDILDGGINNDICNGGGGTDTATRCETSTGIPLLS